MKNSRRYIKQVTLVMSIGSLMLLTGCDISPNMFLQNPIVAGGLVIVILVAMLKMRKK